MPRHDSLSLYFHLIILYILFNRDLYHVGEQVAYPDEVLEIPNNKVKRHELVFNSYCVVLVFA